MKKPEVIPFYNKDRWNFTAMMEEFVSLGYFYVVDMANKKDGIVGHFIYTGESVKRNG